MIVNIFEDLNCSNIESFLKDFENCSLNFFRESKLIFFSVRRNQNETFVVSTGPTIRIAIERANSYVSNGSFTMPTLGLSTKSRLDKLILEYNAKISISMHRGSLVANTTLDGITSEFMCSNVSLGIFLSMLENNY